MYQFFNGDALVKFMIDLFAGGIESGCDRFCIQRIALAVNACVRNCSMTSATGSESKIGMQRQYFETVFGDQVGVLPLRRKAVILGDDGPFIG